MKTLCKSCKEMEVLQEGEICQECVNLLVKAVENAKQAEMQNWMGEILKRVKSATVIAKDLEKRGYKLEGAQLAKFHEELNSLNEQIGLLRRQIYTKPDSFLGEGKKK